MSTEHSAAAGVDHLTVVPENFDPEDDRDDANRDDE